jgi:thiamine-monophosphate kinase
MKAFGQLGEREIIEIIQNHLDAMPEMPIPFGDDISAYDLGDGNLAILKTDMLVGKTDVPPSMSLWQAARKAVVMNVSDFAAKGVKPLAVLVSLGLPAGKLERDVEEIGKGLNAGAREYGTYILGGDTGEASDLVISVSVFGIAKKGQVILRSGAKAGDIVAVTGFFGKSPAGLKILLNGFRTQSDMRQVLVDSVLMPRARLAEGLALSRAKTVSAAIDSSDGLAWSLHEISRASNVGFVIDRLPLADEVKKFAEMNGLDPLELALYGGEEYELVLTIKPGLFGKAKEAVEEVGGELWPIGETTAERRILLNADGKKRVIEPRGYEHFTNTV